MKLWLLFFLIVNASHLICIVLSVNEPKDGKIQPTFDEIYGKGWDKDDHQKIKVETSPLNSGENALNEQAGHDDNIDQDVEAYNSESTDQNLTQEDPESIDQSDDETFEGINHKNKFSEQEKREIISKFHAMRKEYKQKSKYSNTERVKSERKIGIKLGVYRDKIYKWKKEFGLSRKMKEKREFIARINDIKMCQPKKQNKLIKDLGISKMTFYRWKKAFGLPVNSHYSDKKKLELMGKHYKIKRRNPKICESDIANILNIPRTTLRRWKKQFVNSGDEHSLPENNQTLTDNDTSEHPMPLSDDALWAWNSVKKKRTERIEVDTLCEEINQLMQKLVKKKMN